MCGCMVQGGMSCSGFGCKHQIDKPVARGMSAHVCCHHGIACVWMCVLLSVGVGYSAPVNLPMLRSRHPLLSAVVAPPSYVGSLLIVCLLRWCFFVKVLRHQLHS